MMKKLLIIGFVALFFLFPVHVWADIIDFENSGYSEGSNVGAVVTETNVVTFFQSKNTSGGVFNCKIAEVGGSSAYAFFTNIGGSRQNDTPAGGDPGLYFLTDTNIQANAENYFIQFQSPVDRISLDLYDYDNGSGQAVLTAYSGATWTGSVGNYIVATPQGDGSVVNLSVTNPSGPILSASLTWIGGSIDDETGIDNIAFNTVPLPAGIWFLGAGLAGVLGLRKRFQIGW